MCRNCKYCKVDTYVSHLPSVATVQLRSVYQECNSVISNSRYLIIMGLNKKYCNHDSYWILFDDLIWQQLMDPVCCGLLTSHLCEDFHQAVPLILPTITVKYFHFHFTLLSLLDLHHYCNIEPTLLLSCWSLWRSLLKLLRVFN